MTSNVIDFDVAQKHRAGPVRCFECGREWIGVAPVRRSDGGLECPSCHRAAGYYLLSDDEVDQWLCNVAQLMDGWHCDTAWSEWDETLRVQLTSVHVTLASLRSQRRTDTKGE